MSTDPPTRPRRFYKDVTVAPRDKTFVLLLDGRPARTPARAPLGLATPAAAQALADEWAGQGETLDLPAMPITRLVNSALDGVAREMEAVRVEIVRYAGSDLLCYRAAEPASLVAAQSSAWDPVLDWARVAFGTRFVVTRGVMPVAQPDHAVAPIKAALAAETEAVRLACLHTMTVLGGSALLAFAVARNMMPVEAAWDAAHVDEDMQMRAWGRDEDALRRRALRWREMEAAGRLFELLG